MKFKEFKEKVITWGQKYGIEITIGKYKEIIEILTKSSPDGLELTRVLATVNPNKRLSFNLIWGIFGESDISEDAKDALLEIILPFAKTDPRNREYTVELDGEDYFQRI